MAKFGRVARLRRIIGTVGIALVVVGGPVAGQAQAADLDSFSGMGTGFALRVTVDLSGLPSPVKVALQQAYAPIAAASDGALPSDFPYVIDQKFIETLSEMGVKQHANALLGKGFKNFDQVADLTTTGEKSVQTAQHSLPSAELPILDVSVGDLVASIAGGPKVNSTASLASVGVQLDAVGALLPTELQDAFGALDAEIDAAIGTVNGTLDTALGTVAAGLASNTDPVIGGLLNQAGLGDVVGDPADLAAELQDVVNIPSADAILGEQLASVSALKNSARTQKMNDGTVVSEAKSRIAAVNALGLVQTGVINLESLSQVKGTKGSAVNTSECSIADVRVGGANGVGLDGKNLYVNGTAIPVPVGEVGAIKGLLDQVLAQAGLSVELCDAAQSEADEKGTAAAQRVSAFRIEFSPKAVADITALGISAGDELIKIVIDPTVETSVAAQLAAPVEPADEPSLPRTGAAAVTTILSGLGLAGAALLARKRLS